MEIVTYTLGLDGADQTGTCVTCVYFQSYQDAYRSHLDPWEFGQCHHPDVSGNFQFGLYMTCSLHKPYSSPTPTGSVQ